MTAVCISSTRGVDVDKSANYTIATSAPTTNFDFELRYQLLDVQGNAIKVRDLIVFLEALEDTLENGGKLFYATAVTGTNFVGPQI